MTTAMLHQTDLFHPHEDPDDHWDLACVYALAFAGQLDLKGIVIDHPPEGHPGAPDALGIAQLNYVTGLNVPFTVGSSVATVTRPDRQMGASPVDGNAVRMVLETLDTSPVPVVINIVGSCRDIAIAANRAPELFEAKCAGIYLNAGTGSRDLGLIGELEYNVRLNPLAYAAIYDIPCPVYWMPCFEITPPEWRVAEFGTWYSFQQKEILPFLSGRLQNYFTYMLGRGDDVNWLRYLCGEIDRALLDEHGNMYRNMWCTAGFIHAVGRSVTPDGDILLLSEVGKDAVFTFDPIEVECSDNGVTRWRPVEEAQGRFIFHVRDVERYPRAMTAAMKSLLATLP
jgi:hypothetical protein